MVPLPGFSHHLSTSVLYLLYLDALDSDHLCGLQAIEVKTKLTRKSIKFVSEHISMMTWRILWLLPDMPDGLKAGFVKQQTAYQLCSAEEVG